MQILSLGPRTFLFKTSAPSSHFVCLFEHVFVCQSTYLFDGIKDGGETPLAVQWLTLKSQCRQPRFDPWSRN